MAIFRVTAEWSGFTGSPGYSVMHFAGIDESEAVAQAAADAMRGFFIGVEAWLAGGARVSILPAVDIIDETTGQVQDLVNITPGVGATGGSASSYSAVSGAVVHWITNDVKNGRRVRGRNFLVPLKGTAYESNGTLMPTTLATLQNAADTLVSASPDLQVWARPSGPGAADGSAHAVISSRVPDKAAVLRSRRD